MISYKQEKCQSWRSDRFSNQASNESFLDLPKKLNVPTEEKIFEILNNSYSIDCFIPEKAAQELELLFHMILRHKNFDFQVIRQSNILLFIYNFIDYPIQNVKMESYNKDIWQACKLLALFLKYGIFLPNEIASTPLIKTMLIFAKSDDPIQQNAGIDVLSFMIQPNAEIPEIVIRKFMGLAISLRTSFNNKSAKQGCLHFLHEFIRYCPNIFQNFAQDMIDAFSSILKDPKSQDIYADTINCVYMILLYYPQTFPIFLDNGIIEKTNMLLHSHKFKILRSVNHVFSVLFTNEDFDLTNIAPLISYNCIIETANFVLNPLCQKSAIWLLIDISTRGPFFIEFLLRNDLLKFLADIFSEQEFQPKKLIMMLVSNLLFFSGQLAIHIMLSQINEIICNELLLLDENMICNYIKCLILCYQRITMLDNYHIIKFDISESGILRAIMDLTNNESEQISYMARSFTTIAQIILE